MIRPKLLPYKRKKTSNNNTAMSNATLYNLPIGTILLDNQVAGHTFQDGKDAIGKLISIY